MFWSRTGREARRQKVLDELLEVEPADRVDRLQEAVTAGDVRANEVEQALRLVDRLDALRVMTIPRVAGGFRAVHASDLEAIVRNEEVESEFSVPAAPEGPTAERVVKSRERRIRARRNSKAKSGAGVKPRRSRASQDRTAVPIIREPEAIPIETQMPVPAPVEPPVPVAVDPRILAAPLPIDAVEAAARLIARDLAVRKAARTSAVPRRRVRRSSDEVRRSSDEVRRSPEPSLSAVGGGPADLAKPSIDWLRP
ncbi:MAG TPA: hypothetical protein VIK06_11035 [Candidatus Limnocylindrales bacterium]